MAAGWGYNVMLKFHTESLSVVEKSYEDLFWDFVHKLIVEKSMVKVNL